MLKRRNFGFYFANGLTAMRIISAALMFTVSPEMLTFWRWYLIGGISDMADGFIARKANSTSKFGANFDGIADVLFVASVLVNLLPTMKSSNFLWWIAGAIATIRTLNITVAWATKQPIFIHNIPNKIAGMALFTFPMFFRIHPEVAIIVVTALTSFASIRESILVIRRRKQ